jgi:AmiR/NasT family two-component response regulator
VAVTALDGLKRLTGQLEQAMASRAVIEQAKGVIMAMRGITEDEAFEVLRRSSQDRNVKVRALAQQVVREIVEQRREPSGRA